MLGDLISLVFQCCVLHYEVFVVLPIEAPVFVYIPKVHQLLILLFGFACMPLLAIVPIYTENYGFWP